MAGTTSRAWRRVLPLILAVLPLAACTEDWHIPDLPPPPSTGPLTIALGDRPFTLYVPESYDRDHGAPLVIGLHGYTSDSTELETYFRLTAQADARGFLYALPNGTRNSSGYRFWNATDACCDLQGSGVDDSAYLSSLIDTVKQSYAVSAVFVVGHSNGGFMAHRLACDHADQVTAIVSLAGAVWADPARCTPSRPVDVLQIHGTADTLIAYGGGSFAPPGQYPGAEQTIAQWRSLDGCGDTAGEPGAARNLDSAVPGAETSATTYTCPDGSRVELWRLAGSSHVPALTEDFAPAILAFLYASQRA